MAEAKIKKTTVNKAAEKPKAKPEAQAKPAKKPIAKPSVSEEKPKPQAKPEPQTKPAKKPVAKPATKASSAEKPVAEKAKPTVSKEKPVVKEIIKSKSKEPTFYFKAFGRWDTKDIIVQDPGLRRYISLRPVLVAFTAGRHTEKQFWKSKKPIIERLINRVMVSGHRRKKHFRTSGVFSGKKHKAYKTVQEAFEIIERKTKKNPVEVLVRAIETGSPREGITTIEYGGVAYPKAVDLSPQKRIDLVLRWFTQGAFHSSASSKSKNPIARTLADEIIATYYNDNKSTVISRKIEVERQAQASR